MSKKKTEYYFSNKHETNLHYKREKKPEVCRESGRMLICVIAELMEFSKTRRERIESAERKIWDYRSKKQ